MKRHLVTHKFRYNKLDKKDRTNIDIQARLLELADSVRSVRWENNISSRKLAKLAGISQKTMSKIETARPVKLESLLKVLEALDYHIAFVSNDFVSRKKSPFHSPRSD